MLRSYGARLAVPLLLVTTLILVGLEIGLIRTATAMDCRPTPDGIMCGFSGSTSTVSSRRTAPAPLPPLRYLATQRGRCWFWSRYPPGFDSWNSAYDHKIISTRWRLPECGSRAAPKAPVVAVNVSTRAWSIFRSFPLNPPTFHLTPAVGITNLPSRLHLNPPRRFRHSETLPDGRRLDVEATVQTVQTNWGDGAPSAGHGVTTAIGDPGAVRHTYRLKTCPADYRVSHLDGPKCHPALDRYPVTITYRWSARYRTGGSWTALGSIDRPASIRYDVDEVLGVLLP